MFNIVIDTNVLVAAWKSKNGASSKLLRMINDGIYQTHVSIPLVMEYEDALKRMNFLNQQDIDKVISFICSVSVKHKIFYLWRPFLKDEGDDLVLELAFKAKAMIITHNIKDFKGSQELGVKVMTPKEFLSLIGDVP